MPLEKETENRATPEILPIAGLLFRSLIVVLTNMIPLYGVLRLGWESFALIVLFIAEGAVVFLTDVLKSAWVVNPEKKKILFFEFTFIFFFGFFAILIFGRDPDSSDLVETIRTAVRNLAMLSLWPVLVIAAMRLLRTAQDIRAARGRSGKAGEPLHFQGGGWMLLLFFLVMSAPFIADMSPNPRGGLVVVVVLKTLGELAGVWLEKMRR